ncbi:MAG: hypothetical protein ACRENE_03445, partial [Polyangiaceae bacterium]
HESVHALMFELRGLESMADHTTGSGDYYPTVPTVGTLAEGPPLAFGGPDTVGRMTAPPVEGPSLQPFETVSGLDPSGQKPTQHDPEASTTGTGPTIDDEAPTRVAAARHPTIPVYEDVELDTSSPLLAPTPETPMNGEAARSDGRSGSRRGVRRVASALAAAAALGSLGARAFSARSRAVVEAPASSLAASAPSGRASLEGAALGRQPSAEEPSVAPAPLPEWLESASEAARARAASAPQDAGASAARKPISAAPRPSALTVRVATQVPDDGRDELYVPEPRKPLPAPSRPSPPAVRAATQVPDDGRDELYMPEVRKPLSAASGPRPRPAASATRVRDDGYDELYLPGRR